MSQSVRYYILCGEEIPRDGRCSNASCMELPSFYEEIPGPERRRVRTKKPVRRSSESSALAASVVEVVPDAEPRHTMPLDAVPVAVLECKSGNQGLHPIYPGTTDVGAEHSTKVLIDRPEISGAHARIKCFQKVDGPWRLVVTDLDSTNGTYVRGKRVERAEIYDGDIVKFASVEFEVRFAVRGSEDEPRVTMEL